jgi:hypothetical protein
VPIRHNIAAVVRPKRHHDIYKWIGLEPIAITQFISAKFISNTIGEILLKSEVSKPGPQVSHRIVHFTDGVACEIPLL